MSMSSNVNRLLRQRESSSSMMFSKVWVSRLTTVGSVGSIEGTVGNCLAWNDCPMALVMLSRIEVRLGELLQDCCGDDETNGDEMGTIGDDEGIDEDDNDVVGPGDD